MLRNQFLKPTFEQLGELVNNIKPLYKERVIFLADKIQESKIFKKHQCKLNEEKFHLDLNLFQMERELRQKK